MILESSDVAKVEMMPGFFRQTLLNGRVLQMILFTMKKDSVLPEHSHPHEQAGFVVSGSVELTVEGERHITGPGCCYFIYSNQRHSARVLEDSVVVDAFSPPRQEFLLQDDAIQKPSANSQRSPGPNLLESAQVVPVEMFPGFTRRTLLSGENLMMVLFQMQGKSILPQHQHVHEQAGLVLSGSVELTVNESTYVTNGGCCYFIKSNLPHSARVQADSLVVDAFSPPRHEYL